MNLREYNYSVSSGGAPDPAAGPRPEQTYTFVLGEAGEGCEGQEVGVRRLIANGSDAITGVSFDRVSDVLFFPGVF